MASLRSENRKYLIQKNENIRKQKHDNAELKIKGATILGSMPTEGGTMGEGLMAGANRMAQSPHQNAWTGLIEGLMRGFGMGLKGKEAAEKRKQVEDALEVLNYAMEGQEYLKGIQRQIAQKKEDNASMPSENQYMNAVNDGTVKPTIQTMLQEKGIDPNNVTLSDDKMTLFVDKDGKIEKMPVASLFNPEDSKKFGFTNSMVKANLAQSANEQVRGLAQENQQLKQRIQDYINDGASPTEAQSMVQDEINEERVNKQKLGNETMTAEARKRSSLASQDRANLEKELKPLQKKKLELETKKLNQEFSSVEGNTYGSIPKLGLSRGAETNYSKTANAEQSLAKEIPQAMKLLLDGEKLVQDNQNEFGGGWLKHEVLLHKISPSLMPKEKREKYERLEKDSNRIAELFIKSRAAQGQVIEGEQEAIKKGIFNPTGLDSTNKYNIESTKEELVKGYVRGIFTASELEKGRYATATSFERYLESNPNVIREAEAKLGIHSNDLLKLQKQIAREKITEATVEDPQTGEQMKMPIKDALEAINRGGWLR